MALITPPFLQKKDKVAIICMAGKTTLQTIELAIQILESWGLQVIVGETVGSVDGVFGGDDNLRKKDFQTYLNDPEIIAIFSARGGYGSTRILDQIVWGEFQKNPKWIVGFSDITAVISQINNIGMEAIHGPMPKMLGNLGTEKSVDYLKKILFHKPINYQIKYHKNNKLGHVKAEIVGGNLCMLAHSIGSKSEINTESRILFIEDVSEYYYNIDRMLLQLKRAGKFEKLKGLIVGHFTDCKDNDNPFDKSVEEIVLDQTEGYDFPIAFGFPVGHENENWPIICGREVEFVVSEKSVSLKFENNEK
ncbi:MAG: LD-carboxypeptidase [Bacteroidota bacterium]